jgi:hypothetical protein
MKHYTNADRLEQFSCKVNANGYAFACEWLISRTALSDGCSARIARADAALILERYAEMVRNVR